MFDCQLFRHVLPLNSIAGPEALPIFFLVHIWKLLRSYPLTRIFSFDYSARAFLSDTICYPVAAEPALPFAPRFYCFFNIRWHGLINGACFQFIFLLPLVSSRMWPDDEPNFSLARIECRLFHLIYRLWPMHALTLEAPLATASKEGFNE